MNVKNLFRPIFVVMLFLTASTIILAQSKEDFVGGEMLVKFKSGAKTEEINRRSGANVLKNFAAIGWQLVKLPENMSVEQAVNNYQSLAEIEIAQPNYIYKLAATPNDTRFGELWGMQKISAPAAWNVTTGSNNVVVAVIDTGIRAAHEDLAQNLWVNSGEIAGNGVDDDGNGYVDDINGYDVFYNDGDPNEEFDHGSHCAGTIGGAGNNGKGVAGVNWNVKIMALKIYSASGNNSTSAHIIGAFQYIRTMKLRGVNVRVTSNSYGGCSEACGFDQATKDAIDAAGDADLLNVFAAGNGSTNNDTTPFYPSSYNSPSILAVAASDQSDMKAGFSGYGATTVDLAAPGVGILSSTRVSDSSYGFKSGTSMATPHVSGAAALIAARYPAISAQAIKARLINRVDKLANWNGIVASGGRLNVEKALRPAVLDFDGDGRTDLSAVSNSSGAMIWQNLNSLNGNYTAQQFGLFASDVPVPADFDGDGKTDLAVWRGGASSYFYVLNSANNTFQTVQWGISGDLPQTSQDFDGDGRGDFAVTRTTGNNLIWYVLQSGGGFTGAQFGVTGDTPIRGDFDGDGKTDLAVYRPANLNPANTFFVLKSSDGSLSSVNFGVSTTDKAVSADFDGDKKTDFAVWRATNGVWYWLDSTTGAFRAVQFGQSGDVPTPGDYDGDGRTDLSVWRANPNQNQSATFFVQNSNAGNFAAFAWGQNGSKIPAANFGF